MIIESDEIQSLAINSDSCETGFRLYGVVSLFDMLRFYPGAFALLSRSLLGLSALEIAKELPLNDPRIEGRRTDLEYFAKEAKRIGLPLSSIQANRILEAWNAGDRERLSRGAEELDTRIIDELHAKFCYVVAQEKASFLDQGWLANSKIDPAFPSAIPELRRAGRCFAYAENTACVFHLMRVVDLGLRTVADSLQISYEARNWSGISNKITKLMEQKYQLKTDEWRKSEPFYATVLTDIQAISKGYRNEGLHDARKVYEESDADYLLTVVEHFMSNLAANGMKEPREDYLAGL
jgi:hypothetical protein